MAVLLRRSLRIVGRQMTTISVLLAVIMLLGIGSAYLLSNAIAERKDDIAAWASEKTGYPIQIGEAGLYWFALFPKLLVTDIKVMQAAPDIGELFTAKELYIGVDLIASLQQRQLVVDSARLSGLHLGLKRTRDGVIELTGLHGNLIKQATDNDGADWLAQFRRWHEIELLSAEIQLDDEKQPQLSGLYQLNRLSVVQNKQTELLADIQLPHHLGEQLSFAIQADLHSAGISSWQLKQLEGRQLQLAALLEGQVIQGISLSRGRANVSLQATSLLKKQWRGELQLTDATLLNLNNPDVEPVRIDSLSGLFDWHGDTATWQLETRQLRLSVAGEPWPQSNVTLQFSVQDGWMIDSQFLRLSDITNLALLSNSAPELLTQFQPAGDLHNVQLRLDPESRLLSAKMTVEEFASLPVNNIPGVTGLSLQVDWRPNTTQLTLNSRNLTVFAPEWLPAAIHLDVAEADVDWQQLEQDWQLHLTEVNLWNSDLTLRGRATVQQQANDTLMDMDLQLLDAVVSNWLSYVPRAVLDPDYLQWAEDAYTSGIIENGRIRLAGNLAAFPFAEEDPHNQFAVSLDVVNVGLNYGDGWPVLEAVDGQVISAGNHIEIRPRSGKIAGFNFEEVSAVINQVYDGQPVLDLTGMLSGQTQKALDFLQNSPLASRYGDITSWIQAQGSSRIALQLTIPLLDPDATDVDGYISFERSQLTLPALPAMPIEEVTGRLLFNNDGVTGQELAARIFDQPAEVEVIPQANTTLVSAKGKIASTDIGKLWQGDMPAFVSGSTGYQADIAIREKSMGEFITDIQVSSDLSGIAIDAPEPIGKIATEVRPLSVQLNDDELQRSLLTLNYADSLRAVMLMNQPLRAEITLGYPEAQLPDSGVRLRGYLHNLSASQWTDWQQKWQKELSANTQQAWPAMKIELATDRLHFNQWTLNDVQATAALGNDTWQFAVQSRQLAGNIRWPVAGRSLPVLQFDFVDIQLPASTNGAASGQKPPAELWPGFELYIDNLSVDGMQLGKLQARAVQQGRQWTLESASLHSPALQADLSGRWSRDGANDSSQLNLRLTSRDLAGLLIALGYQPTIEAEKAEVTGDFNWPSAPLNLSLASLQGQLALQVGKGQLVDIKPGAAGRIFGLLSFAAIPRRLSLDFSDFFGKGLSFRDISGDFTFANGLAVTDNLTMRSDSASIEVTGPINIVDRTYHQTVLVTPNVSSSLPLAGAVAGGPVGLGVGTAILLMDRLAGRIFDRELVDMISYRYRLTGTWDEPEFALNRPDTP